MPSVPTELPEPIPAPKSAPPRGRDRALSAPPAKKNAAPPPPNIPAPGAYEYAPPEEPLPAATDNLTAPAAPPVPPSPRAPFWRRHIGTWVVVLAVIGLALAFTLPFTLGVYLGNQQRQETVDRLAEEHFQRALAYESETYDELAIAELNVALQYKPDYAPAQAKLAELKSPRAVKTLEPQDLSIAKQLYDSAQQAVATRSWSDAIDLFEELRRVKNDYMPDEVTTAPVTAYVAAGKEALAANDVDLAQRRFDAALALDSQNADARTLHDRGILYQNGTHALGSDYPGAVTALAELYKRDPKFADVQTKLRAAHIGYGDFADAQGAFCIAAREYDAALALGASSDVQARSDAANGKCKDAILNPTPLPTATVEGGLPPEVGQTPGADVPPGLTTPVPSGPVTVAYSGQMRVRQNAKCTGSGDIKGSVQDAAGRPIPNVGVKIYNDYGYLPPYARTDIAGEYEIGLGSDKGLFHLVIVDDFGSNVSEVVNVDYPGGNVQGCHIVVTWTHM